jgi:hypothetical protein
VYRKCRQDLIEAWPRVAELLNTRRRVVEEETRNSITQQKYLRFRVIVDMTPDIVTGSGSEPSLESCAGTKAIAKKQVKLGKPFPNKEHAEHSYSIAGYKVRKGDADTKTQSASQSASQLASQSASQNAAELQLGGQGGGRTDGGGEEMALRMNNCETKTCVVLCTSAICPLWIHMSIIAFCMCDGRL